MKLYVLETSWGLYDEFSNNIVGVFDDPIVVDEHKRKLQSHVDYINSIYKEGFSPLEEMYFTEYFQISVKEIELNEILNYTNILCK